MHFASGRPRAHPRLEDSSHVPDTKTSVTPDPAEGRGRVDRPAFAGRYESGRHGPGTDGAKAQPASRLRFLSARRSSRRMATRGDRPELRVSIYPGAAETTPRVRDRGE